MENFLNKKYGGIHQTPEVKSAKKRTEASDRENVSEKPAELVQNYLDRFSEILQREDPSKRERGVEALKQVLHKEHIIQEENIPEATFLLEQRIAEVMGKGEIELSEELKTEKTKEIINNQTQSLDRWTNYLSSTDADDAGYPDWARYWAFRSVTEMGKFEKKEDEDGKETARFKKRTKDTVAPFPMMNPRAIAMTIGSMKSKLEEQSKAKNERQPIENKSSKLDDEAFKNLLTSENFSKIYTQFLVEMPEYSTEGLKEIRGKWITYAQNTNPQELVDSLEGYPLEWCTANYDTAETHLQGGDFHTYYSLNSDGEATIPRVAIRMEGNKIAEVRGIAADQEVDPYITPVIDEKMDTFGAEAEQYKKKSEDMKKMTELSEKSEEGREFSIEDLRFLYEIDSKIQGFGYEKDPRIEKLIEGRDKRVDLSKTLDCLPEQISLNEEEALRGDIIFHYGYLNLNGLTSAEGLTLPETVNGNIGLISLTSAEGLTLPETMNGDLGLSSLTSAEGLTLPETMNGDLYLSSLTSAEGLTLPETMNGNIGLSSLASAEGLTLPETVNGNIGLSSLTSAEGLTLPETVNGNIGLSSLTSAEGLTLPETVNGGLYLSSLTSAEGLTLPETMNGGLYLNGLTSAEGLTLPETMNGYLNLNGLTSAEGLTLPETVNGNIGLSSLTSAEGLTLPETMNGDLGLSSLTSAEGLTLPETVNGGLYLNGLASAEKQKLREKYPHLAENIR